MFVFTVMLEVLVVLCDTYLNFCKLAKPMVTYAKITIVRED